MIRAAARAADMNLRASRIELDVKQDCPCGAVHGEVVEQIGEIDVDAVANGDDGGKSDTADRGPLHQAGRNGAGLRNQRKVARGRRGCGEAGVELRARHQNAEAIGADEAHARRASVLLGEFCQRPWPVTEPGGDDDAGRGAFPRRCGDGIRNGRRRHRNHRDVGRLRQSFIGFDRMNAFDRVIVRIDDMNRTREARSKEVFDHGATG